MIFASKDSIYLGYGTVFKGFVASSQDITEKTKLQLENIIKEPVSRDLCISVEEDHFDRGYYNYNIRVFYPLLEGDYLKKYVNRENGNNNYLDNLLNNNENNNENNNIDENKYTDKYLDKNIENSVKTTIQNIIKNTKFTSEEIELMNTIVEEFEACEPYWYVATDYECYMPD